MSKHPTGLELLRNPALTKSTAFTLAERKKYKLRGLLPTNPGTMKKQMRRVLANLRRKHTDIGKYIYLSALQDRNERLFYRLVIDNIDEIMPLIYTPTVGQACKEFANIFRTEKGFYISIHDRGDIRKILKNWPHKDIRIIVITDGERILGLGDLGASGLGIPIGKLSLYCACAGVHPHQCLPVMFDVGTDNENLLQDEAYLGLPKKRLRGKKYFELMDEFISAANQEYPGVLIQFEDFIAKNAFGLLQKYRNRVLCFNDDIQGTAAVALAGVYASTRRSGIKFKDMRFAFLGAGSAAAGIGRLIASALVQAGVDEAEAYRRLWFFNKDGLITKRGDETDFIKPCAHDCPKISIEGGLLKHKPHVLIGATGVPGVFTKKIIKAMASFTKHPAIFALSNPTSRAECSAEQAYEYSDGRAIFASGSPFDAVECGGKLLHPGQANNAYIFPGVGLGVIAAQATTITDEMFACAAKSLAAAVSDEDLNRGAIYPPLSKIRKVSLDIAVAVAKYAWQNNLTNAPQPHNIRAYIKNNLYEPEY